MSELFESLLREATEASKSAEKRRKVVEDADGLPSVIRESDFEVRAMEAGYSGVSDRAIMVFHETFKARLMEFVKRAAVSSASRDDESTLTERDAISVIGQLDYLGDDISGIVKEKAQLAKEKS